MLSELDWISIVLMIIAGYTTGFFVVVFLNSRKYRKHLEKEAEVLNKEAAEKLRKVLANATERKLIGVNFPKKIKIIKDVWGFFQNKKFYFIKKYPDGTAQYKNFTDAKTKGVYINTLADLRYEIYSGRIEVLEE